MTIGELAEFKTDFPDADFWLIRKGTIEKVGKPTKEFSKEHIGVKVVRTDVLVPDYLYYAFEWLNSSGKLQMLAHGSLALKHINISDIKEIPIG
jgi:restriction endonuclease S subunit